MRRFVILVFACVSGLLAAAGAGCRAGTPDWARPIVEGAASAPEPDPYWTWRQLFYEWSVTVEPDGEVRTRRREVRQILSSEIDQAMVSVAFDARRTIRRLRAWHVRPEARRARRASRRDAIDVASGPQFLSDDATRVLPISDLEKGSLVVIETVTTAQPYQLTRLYWIGQGVPVLRHRVVFEIPEGFALESEWVRGAGPDPQRTGRRFVWERTNLPGQRVEPQAPPIPERLPLLAISVIAQDARLEAASFRSWQDLGLWATRMIEDQQKNRSALDSWSGTAGQGVSAIREQAQRVRDAVRYVAVSLRKSGFQPRPVDETIETGWGDCKDKATLLTALLDERGVRAWPVVVNSSQQNTVPARVPVAGAFNHMIVALAAGDLELDEKRFGGALGDGGDLGPLLFFDPTDPYVPFGTLSASLAGRRALVLAGKDSRLVTLPGDEPGWHVREGELEGTLAGNGALAIAWKGRYRGEPARVEWSSLRSSSRQQREDLERFWRDVWPRANSLTYEGRMDEPAGEFVESASTTVRPSSLGDRRDLPLLAMPGWWLPHPRISSRRKVGVEFGYPRTLRLHAIWRGLDESWVLPAEISRTIDGASARARARRRDDGAVEVEAEIVLERRSFAVDELRALRRFLSTCRAVERLSASRAAQPNTPGSSSPSDE